MKINEASTKLLSTAHTLMCKGKFAVKKHSPEILLVSGIVTGIVGVVAACKASTKVSSIVEETKSTIDTIHKSAEAGSITTSTGTETYSEEDKNKDLMIVYVQTGARFLKLYAPAAALGVLSLVSILASHNILKQRNVSLAVAYSAVDTAFKEYRKRVAAAIGDEDEKEIRYNVKAKTTADTVRDTDSEEEHEILRTEKEIDPNVSAISPYAKFFDESSRMWEKNADANRFFLECAQQWSNDKLRADGYLFLNDVYIHLGMEPTVAGQTVGWLYDPKDLTRDSYVDFGLYAFGDGSKIAFMNGLERCILLDFNCDGDILHDKKFTSKYRAI